MTKKKKILVVEDEPMTLKLYSHLLEETGCEVIATPQANEALRLAKDNKPNLFIMDLMLQSGDGFDVIKKLRAIVEFKKTPIIVLSNLGQESDIEEAIKKGATKYFIKSNTRFEQIIAEVKKMIG